MISDRRKKKWLDFGFLLVTYNVKVRIRQVRPDPVINYILIVHGKTSNFSL